MTKHYVFPIEIFGTYVCVLFSDDDGWKIVDYVTDTLNVELSDSMKGNLTNAEVDGMYVTVEFEDGVQSHLIIINRKNDGFYRALAHESQHCCFELLKSRGVNHTDDTDEVFSYTLGHIFDTAMKHYNEFNKEIEDDRNKAKHRRVPKDGSNDKRRNTRKSNS